MDLDPGDGVAWETVIAAAREIRERLERRGTDRLCQNLGRQGPACRGRPAEAESRVAGGQGLHQILCRRDGRRQSTSAMSPPFPRRSGTGKILIDYLRNQRGATAVAAYSRGRGPARPSRCRSTGTNSGRQSARPISPSPTRRSGLRPSRAIRGKVFAPPRRRSKKGRSERAPPAGKRTLPPAGKGRRRSGRCDLSLSPGVLRATLGVVGVDKFNHKGPLGVENLRLAVSGQCSSSAIRQNEASIVLESRQERTARLAQSMTATR